MALDANRRVSTRLSRAGVGFVLLVAAGCPQRSNAVDPDASDVVAPASDSPPVEDTVGDIVEDTGADPGPCHGITSLPAASPGGPPSTAIVTSQRPTFRWGGSSYVRGACVEICRDRSCTDVIAHFSAQGASGRPDQDLPPGVWFWRAHGILNVDVSIAASPPWEVFVGARTTPVDSTRGMILDVNGDGFADVAVGSPSADSGNGRVYLYLGGPAGLATVPSVTLLPPVAQGEFGTSVAGAGDADGDGFGDLLVGAPGVNGGTGQVYLYLGGPSGLGATPARVFVGLDQGGRFGAVVAGVGGGEFVVGASNANNGSGRVYVYYPGFPSGPESSLASPTPGARFGFSIAGAGDVNGDGSPDVIVGAPAAGGTGIAAIYLGAGLLATQPSVTLVGAADNAGFGTSVASAGDVNGDGYADVIVGAPDENNHAGSARVYLGGAAGIDATSATELTAADSGGLFGTLVAGAGDVNHDGFGDVLVGAPGSGRVFVYLGGAAGLATIPLGVLTASDVGLALGNATAGVGDVDGDGFDDVAATGSSVSGDVGRVYLFRGFAGGLDATPAATLTAPDAASIGFGAWIATRTEPGFFAGGSERGSSRRSAHRDRDSSRGGVEHDRCGGR